MTPPFTQEALHQLLRRYYPENLLVDEPGYKESEQARRLTQRLNEAEQDMSAWKTFVQRVREELPGCGFWDATLMFMEPCYRLRVQLPETVHHEGHSDAVVCLLSVLAPVYVVYASHYVEAGEDSETWVRFPPLPPAFQPYEAKLARLIEAAFSATRLPEEVFSFPIPELDPRTGNTLPGTARIIDLLFTTSRW
ncbi:MAG TPA: hypothetical protein VK539_26715 [Myxococcaceae bacterium]|nr:hypothetical protein [Myxococcaceae bacterium]